MLHLTKTNFQQTILDNAVVFIDFWALWCGLCRRFTPIFERAAANNRDLVFAEVDTDAEAELATLLEIRSVPTVMVFRDQVLLYAEPGAPSEKVLDGLIRRVRTLDMNEVRRRIAEHRASQAQTARDPGSESPPEAAPKSDTGNERG